MRKQVEEVLNMIRPALQADGGDVELVDVTDDGRGQRQAHGSLRVLPHVHHDPENGDREKPQGKDSGRYVGYSGLMNPFRSGRHYGQG